MTQFAIGGENIYIDDICIGCHGNVSTGECGDIDGDEDVNVSDVVILVGIILNLTDDSEYPPDAVDVNGDGAVDVVDVVYLVSIILGLDDTGLERGIPASYGDIRQKSNQLFIKSDGDIAGVQLEVTGAFYITSSLLPNGWELEYSDEMVLIFSMDGSSLDDGILFEYEGDMSVKSGIIADWHGNGITAEVVEIPGSFYLAPAYPNPFNPETTVSYAIPTSGQVDISVYDMMGHEVMVLIHEVKEAGNHSVKWNAESFSSGVYFIKMSSQDYIVSQKVMLIK